MADQKFCPRCGNLGVKRTDATREIWDCETHGVIFEVALPVTETKALAPGVKPVVTAALQPAAAAPAKAAVGTKTPTVAYAGGYKPKG